MDAKNQLYPKDIIASSQYEKISKKDIIFKLADYLHEIFGTIGCLIKEFNCSAQNNKVCIPIYFTRIILTILRYNNIIFDAFTTVSTNTDLIEPMWFSMEFTETCNSITIYFNEAIINSLRAKLLTFNVPIILEPFSEINLLTKFNAKLPTQASADYIYMVQPQVISMFILCDHLAQHVIKDYWLRLQKPSNQGFIIETTHDIHENWLDCPGLTWHSATTIIAKNKPKPRNNAERDLIFTNNDGIYYN